MPWQIKVRLARELGNNGHRCAGKKRMQKEVNKRMARGEALENKHFGAFLCFLAVLPGDPFVWFIGLRMLKDVSWGQQRLAKVKRQILVYRTALYSDVQTNSSSTYSLVAWYLNCRLSYWAFCHYELWVCTLKFCERFAIVSGISSDLVGIWWDYPIHESQLVPSCSQGFDLFAGGGVFHHVSCDFQ